MANPCEGPPRAIQGLSISKGEVCYGKDAGSGKKRGAEFFNHKPMGARWRKKKRDQDDKRLIGTRSEFAQAAFDGPRRQWLEVEEALEEVEGGMHMQPLQKERDLGKAADAALRHDEEILRATRGAVGNPAIGREGALGDDRCIDSLLKSSKL